MCTLYRAVLGTTVLFKHMSCLECRACNEKSLGLSNEKYAHQIKRDFKTGNINYHSFITLRTRPISHLPGFTLLNSHPFVMNSYRKIDKDQDKHALIDKILLASGNYSVCPHN